MDTGIHRGLSFDDYLGIDALNWSTLKLMGDSPASMRWHLDNPAPQKSSAAMQLGTDVHAYLEDPKAFAATVAVEPADLKGPKAGNGKRSQWRTAAEAAGLRVLSSAEWEKVVNMATDEAKKQEGQPKLHPCMRGPGDNELTLVWTNPFFDRLCKARIDRVYPGPTGAVVVDTKTTKNAERRAFANDAFRYEYHAQAAWYADGWERVTGTAPAASAILAIQSSPPYSQAFYRLDPDTIESGRRTYSIYLDMLAKCEASGVWPGYENATIERPKWYSEPQLPHWALSGGATDV